VHVRIKLAGVVAVVGAVAVAGSAAIAGDGNNEFAAGMRGYEEVPAVSTQGLGAFTAKVNKAGTAFSYRVAYAGLEGNVTQSHIHFGQTAVNGGISAFFCSNLGNGPLGTQPCPPSPAVVTGTITAADVIGPAAQGISPGEFNELLRAIRAGVTYANVHSSTWPGGEIRGQVRSGGDDD
jgi:hypothetical protein